jgi:hypothetical protein
LRPLSRRVPQPPDGNLERTNSVATASGLGSGAGALSARSYRLAFGATLPGRIAAHLCHFLGPTSSMQRVLITRSIESLWLTILVLSLIPIPSFQDQSRPGRAPMIDPKLTISPIQDA